MSKRVFIICMILSKKLRLLLSKTEYKMKSFLSHKGIKACEHTNYANSDSGASVRNNTLKFTNFGLRVLYGELGIWISSKKTFSTTIHLFRIIKKNLFIIYY